MRWVVFIFLFILWKLCGCYRIWSEVRSLCNTQLWIVNQFSEGFQRDWISERCDETEKILLKLHKNFGIRKSISKCELQFGNLGNCVDKSIVSVVQQKLKWVLPVINKTNLSLTSINSTLSPLRLKSMNLYYLPPSPPCRAVLMLGRILGVDFNLKTVNIQEGEHMKKDFLEVNIRFRVHVRH